MSPSPLKPLAPAERSLTTRRRRRRRPDPWQQLGRHTRVMEIGARLSVNGFLALVAMASLARLVPHLQSQVQQLDTVRQELAQAQVTNTRLRSDFDRYFDPAQAGRVIQEQTGYRARSERQVVWTD